MDIKNPDWTLDVLYEKHLKFSKSLKELPDNIRDILIADLSLIRDSLKQENINVTDLKITRYDKADPESQTMLLDSTKMTNVYIIQGKNSFKRVLLLNDSNRIESWITLKDGKIFLKI